MISDSHIVALEKSGHSLFLEEKEKFNAELIRFAGKQIKWPKINSQVYDIFEILFGAIFTGLSGWLNGIRNMEIFQPSFHNQRKGTRA
jgi:hypothetical protein